MSTKPISPANHCLIDYALVGSLLLFPTVLKFPNTVRKIYAVEALTLLVYVALTDHPAAVKPLIPIKIHSTVDPFNVAGFALQTFSNPFKHKKARMFNIAFTILAGLTVLLTDWKSARAID